MLQIPESGILVNTGFDYNERATHHFFFGDVTAIEVFNHLKQTALHNGHEYFGVLELYAEQEVLLTHLQMLVDSVLPGGAIQWMEEMHPNCWRAWKNATFYLAGKPGSIQVFKAYLLKKDVHPRQIQTLAAVK